MKKLTITNKDVIKKLVQGYYNGRIDSTEIDRIKIYKKKRGYYIDFQKTLLSTHIKNKKELLEEIILMI